MSLVNPYRGNPWTNLIIPGRLYRSGSKLSCVSTSGLKGAMVVGGGIDNYFVDALDLENIRRPLNA